MDPEYVKAILKKLDISTGPKISVSISISQGLFDELRVICGDTPYSQVIAQLIQDFVVQYKSQSVGK